MRPRTRYTPLEEQEKIKFPPTITQQNKRESTNINLIMDKAKKTGILPSNKLNVEYGDFTLAEDLQDAFTKVEEARTEFDRLPGKVRKKFGQNPVAIMDFLSKEENREEAIELGLIEKPLEETKDIGEILEKLNEKLNIDTAIKPGISQE